MFSQSRFRFPTRVLLPAGDWELEAPDGTRETLRY